MDDRKRKSKHVPIYHPEATQEVDEQRKRTKMNKRIRKLTIDGMEEQDYRLDDGNGCEDEEREEEEDDDDDDDDNEETDTPFSGRKLCMGIVVVFIYLLVVFGLIILIYKTTEDLVKSLRNPVRSLKYYRVDKYKAPAIVVFPVGNNFMACSHYFHNIIGSKTKLEELDLENKACEYLNVTYNDPINNLSRNALVFKGPTRVKEIEALFLHFIGLDKTKDFFAVSYYILSSYKEIKESPSPSLYLKELHGRYPTYALSANMRMWIKMKVKGIDFNEINHVNEKQMDFETEFSTILYRKKRFEGEPFFIFFEWKNNLMEISTLLYTVTPWSVVASLCGILVTFEKFTALSLSFRKKIMKVRQQVTGIRRSKA